MRSPIEAAIFTAMLTQKRANDGTRDYIAQEISYETKRISKQGSYNVTEVGYHSINLKKRDNTK